MGSMVPATALGETARAGLASGAIAAALFYSRRTAETFARLAGDLRDRTRLGMLCLSETVAAPLIAAHFVRVALADHPSEEAMARWLAVIVGLVLAIGLALGVAYPARSNQRDSDVDLT